MMFQPSPLFGLKVFVDNDVPKGKIERRPAEIYMHQQTYNLLINVLDKEKNVKENKC